MLIPDHLERSWNFPRSRRCLSLDVLVLAGTATRRGGIGARHRPPDTPPATRLLLAVATPVLLVPLFSSEVARTSKALAASLAGWVCSTLLLGVVAILCGARPATAQLAPLLMVALGIVVVTRLAASATSRLLQAAGLDEPAAREWARWLAAAMLLAARDRAPWARSRSQRSAPRRVWNARASYVAASPLVSTLASPPGRICCARSGGM